MTCWKFQIKKLYRYATQINMLVKMDMIDFNQNRHDWNYSHEDEWFTSKYLIVVIEWYFLLNPNMFNAYFDWKFHKKRQWKKLLVIILSCKYVDENIIIKFKMNSLWKDHSSKILWFVVSSFSIDKWRVSFLYDELHWLVFKFWMAMFSKFIKACTMEFFIACNRVTPLKVVTTMHTLVVTTFQICHYYKNKVFLLEFFIKKYSKWWA